MTSRDDRVQISAEIPIETNEALETAKQRHDQPKWKEIDEALRLHLGLDAASELAGLERRIQQLEDDLDALHDERDVIGDKISSIKEELEHARAEKKRLEEKRGTYTEELDEVLVALEEDPTRSVYAYRSDLRAAAVIKYGQPTEETLAKVVADLRERAVETGVDVNEEQFEARIVPKKSSRKRGEPRKREDDFRLAGVESDD